MINKALCVIPVILASMAMSCSDNQNVNYPKGELPVSRVVMYQSGIGYVERNAVVDGDELVLRIRPDQINDILKSLTVIDRSNGRPVSISLPVDHTTLDSLSQIPDQVRSGGIRSMLEAFRGAHVKIRTNHGSSEGRIVGVETVLKQVMIDEVTEDETTVTLLTKNNALDVIKVNEIQSVSLYDKNLADGLDKSLNISLNEGDWKQVELRIRMDSAKKRELALSYLVAMPTWKPAYRLILGKEDKGTLQGWAIVSNVTGADWNDISFSLVSGQPMSFTYDLYRPQFLTRPDLTSLGAQKAVAPVVTQSAYQNVRKEEDKGAAMPAKAMHSKQAAAKRSNAMLDMAEAAMVEEESMMDEAMAGEAYFEEPAAAPIADAEMAAGFAALASNTQLGSFDEYRLKSKLTIPDGNTALVNLIQNEVTARDTRMFKPVSGMRDYNHFYKGWRETESYQTIELKNEIGVSLDSGPITIYRDSAVIGEGYLSRTEKDSTAYITFAKEGRMQVEVTDSVSTNTQMLSTIQNGICEFDNVEQTTKTFTFTSHIEHEAISLLQVPRFSQWKPVDFPDNVVSNDNSYVISANVPANGTVNIALTMVNSQKFSGRPIAPKRGGDCVQAIKNAIKSGDIQGEQLEPFQQYVNDADALEVNRTKTSTLIGRRDEIQKDQGSLSQTLAGLKDIKTSNADALRRQLVSRQQSNEKSLVDITTELYGLQVEKGEIELRMQSYLKSLSYIRK